MSEDLFERTILGVLIERGDGPASEWHPFFDRDDVKLCLSEFAKRIRALWDDGRECQGALATASASGATEELLMSDPLSAAVRPDRPVPEMAPEADRDEPASPGETSTAGEAVGAISGAAEKKPAQTEPGPLSAAHAAPERGGVEQVDFGVEPADTAAPPATVVLGNVLVPTPERPLPKAPAAPDGATRNARRRYSLPNASVGRHYRESLAVAIGLGDVSAVELEDLPNTGLRFDPGSCTLLGDPTLPGDHVFTMRFRSGGRTSEEWFEADVQLIVNPDPRSLWEDLPVDSKAPYQREINETVYEERGERRIVGASRRGRSHAHEARFRDDALRVDFLPESGWHIVSVADGAGSARFSRRGAELACEAAHEFLAEAMVSVFDPAGGRLLERYKAGDEASEREIMNVLYRCLAGAAFKGHRAISEEAKARNAAIRDYATTLLTAVVKHFSAGWFVATYWVGDGGIGLYQAGKKVIVLGQPDGGEFAGQTRFLTMPDMMENRELARRLNFAVVEDFTALLLMTDGITDPKFQTDANLQRLEYWDRLWKVDLAPCIENRSGAESAELLLDWLQFHSVGNHDDRTIVVLT